MSWTAFFKRSNSADWDAAVFIISSCFVRDSFIIFVRFFMDSSCDSLKVVRFCMDVSCDSLKADISDSADCL